MFLAALTGQRPLLGETPVREAERSAWEPQRQGEDGRVQCPHLDGKKERIGGILVFSFNLLGLLNALLSGFSSLMFKMYYSNRVILIYILSVQL